MEFKNLKIEIFLNNSVALQPNKGAFDSVLALLYFNELQAEGIFDGDYSKKLHFLDMTDGVYHTSFPELNGVKYYDKEKLIKKFDHDMYAKYGEIVSKTGKERGVVNNVQGKYKNEFYSIERILAQSIVYYVRGDRDIIEGLLRKLRFLGKKSSLGWGEIKSVVVEEIDKDFSIQKGGKLMRNIPSKNGMGLTSNKIKLMRLVHPYWKKTDVCECFVP